MGVAGEDGRIEMLRSLGVLDAPVEERFDWITRLTQQIFGVSYAGINLIDTDRQWSLAQTALQAPREVPRSESMCAHTIRTADPLVVPDARADERFREKAAVRAGVLRFYAGQPLEVNGERVGALCIADDSPRELSEKQVELLGDLGQLVEVELSRTRELWQAADVQRRLLPARAPDLPGFEVAGQCVQARVVGGDFFDWHVTDGHLQVVIADVMGKGLSAAILAASVRATLRVTTRFNPLDVAVTKAATSIAEDFEEPGGFVTAFVVSLDYHTGRLDYIDAGHGLAIIIDDSGGARRLIGEQPPFGIDLGHEWHIQQSVLEPGETLVAVSDGFMDFFDNPWDSIDAAVEVSGQAATAKDLVDDFIAYAVSRVPLDDVSVVAIRRHR